MSRIQLALNVDDLEQAVAFTAVSSDPSRRNADRATPTSPSPIRP